MDRVLRSILKPTQDEIVKLWKYDRVPIALYMGTQG